MQLPASSLHFMRFVRFAYYLAARLQRAGHTDWADEARAAGNAVRDAGRAVEDKGLEAIAALANRDAVDDGLDDIADEVRRTLAGVSNTAMRERPYTDIFPNGVAYVTDAPLDEQANRYRDLAARIEQFLEETHALRANAAPIREQLVTWGTAREALADARALEGRTKTDFDGVHDRFEQTMERIYGRLVEAYGRRKADRSFPRQRSADEKDSTPEPVA